jgi:hypothetical protein
VPARRQHALFSRPPSGSVGWEAEKLFQISSHSPRALDIAALLACSGY